MSLLLSGMAGWTLRHWSTAAVTAAGTVAVIGIPTDLVDTPLFNRMVPPTWWSYPILGVTAILAGLLVATYVADPAGGEAPRREQRWGGAGGVLSFFAVGCPVCNKLVLLALGTSGALQYFEPVQPVLALASVTVLAWALWRRLRNAASCVVTAPDPTTVKDRSR